MNLQENKFFYTLTSVNNLNGIQRKAMGIIRKAGKTYQGRLLWFRGMITKERHGSYTVEGDKG